MIREVLSCPSALEFLPILIASFTVSGWMLFSGSGGGLPSFLEVAVLFGRGFGRQGNILAV